MPFSTAAKNAMLDSLTLNRVRLHNGDPGPNGTDNALGSLTAAVFAAASGGYRELDDNVDFAGFSASQEITWFSVWTASGTAFRASGQITTGATTASPDGNYVLVAGSTTRVGIEDPA